MTKQNDHGRSLKIERELKELVDQLSPDGPPLDENRLQEYVCGMLDPEDADEVRRNVATYRSWYKRDLDLRCAITRYRNDLTSDSGVLVEDKPRGPLSRKWALRFGSAVICAVLLACFIDMKLEQRSRDQVQERTQKAAALYAQLKNYYESGEYDTFVTAVLELERTEFASLDDDREYVGGLLDGCGKAFIRLKQPDNAQKWYQKAIERRVRDFPKGDPRIAQSMGGLATAYDLMGKSELAKNTYYEAIAAYPDPPDGGAALLYINFGKMMNSEGNVVEAERLVKFGLELPMVSAFDRVYGIMELGYIYSMRGDVEAMDQAFNDALILAETGQDTGVLLPELFCRGVTTKSNLGQFQYAHALLTRFKSLDPKLFGMNFEEALNLPPHMRLARAEFSVASGILSSRTGDGEGAIREFKDAVAVRQSLGRNTGNVHRYLAKAYLQEGRLAEASESIANELKSSPPPLQKSIALWIVASIAFERGDVKEAEKNAAEALTLQRMNVPNGHPSIALSELQLAVLISLTNSVGDIREFQKYLASRLDILKQLQDNDQRKIDGYAAVGSALMATGNPHRGKVHLETAATLLQKSGIVDSASFIVIENNLAVCFQNLKLFEEAEETLTIALQRGGNRLIEKQLRENLRRVKDKTMDAKLVWESFMSAKS